MITTTRTRITAGFAAVCIAAGVMAAPAAADPPYGANPNSPTSRTDTNPGTSVRDAPMGLGSAGHGTPVRAPAGN
jgi:hypothetical protein